MSGEQMTKVSDFGRELYGVSDVPRQAWINYGKALLTIAGADGTYAEAERSKVVRAARALSVPDDIVLTLHALIDMEKAVYDMRAALFHVTVLE